MKKPLLFTLLLFLVAFAWATSYTIGTGTSSTSYSPFYGLYDYGWNKIIYTAAEINTAGLTGPANLYGFGFYAYNTPANHILLDQKVYLRHTALANYGTATDETGTGYPASAGFTQVYSADVVYNGLGWYYLTFSSPFAWDGTSNIEILYENWDGDYYSGYPTHTYTSTSTNYMTVYKYADTTFPTTVGTRTYNRPNFRLLTQPLDAPVAATLVAPADGAWAFNDVSLIWNNGQGMASSYDLYLGTASDPPLLTNTTDMVYAPTVSAGTTYYWKVVAKNVDGTAAASPIRSFTTAGANQLAESFENTTFPPTGWTNPGAFTRSTTTPYHLTAGAYKSTAAAAMLYTPMLELTATSELNFMARAGATTGIGRIQIKYSADGTTWTAIGAEIAMPANSNWNNYVVDLSSLAGDNYMIGFENYSSTATAAAIYIDYVFGPDFAALTPDPATVIYPADAGYAFLDGTLQWNPAASGGIPSSYDVYFGTTNPPDYVTNQAELTYTPTLAAATTYYWQIVPRNGTGPAVNCPVWSFNTPGATQLAESFDDTSFPPLGWTNVNNAWSRSTGTPFYGAASAYDYTSAATMLYTPMLGITASDVLDFWARASVTTEIGRLQIKYSSDGTTWNPIGAEIAMPANTSWNNYIVDLSTLSGNNYFIGFEIYSSTTSSMYIYIDHVFGPNYAAIAPGAPTLTDPADLATDVNEYTTFEWDPPTTGGIPTGYNLYLDTASGSTLYASNVTSPYTPATALAYETTYYWTVAAYNGSGTGPGATVQSFTTGPDPTVSAFPYVENFDAVTTPALPYGWTVVDNNADGDAWVTSTTNSNSTPNCVRIYTDYNAANDDYLVTPPVVLTGNQELKFWVRSNSASEPDEISVLLSTTTPTAAAFTNVLMPSTAVDYTTYTEYTVDLSSYTGTCYISFTRKDAPADGWYLHLDDVLIRNIPTEPIFSLMPDVTSWDFGEVLINTAATQEFTITNTGGGTLNLSSVSTTGLYYSISVPPADMELTAGESTSFTLQYLPTVEGGPYTGTLDITDNRTPTTVTLTGTCFDPTIYTMPWLENFGTDGDPFPPTNWNLYSGLMVDPIELTTATSYWYQDDFANVVESPTNESARMNIYGTIRKGWLVSPPVQMPGTGYQLEFDIALTDYGSSNPPDDPAGLSGVDDRFAVLIGDGVNWSTTDAVKIWDNDDLTTGGIYEVYNSVSHTGDHYVIPLDAYTGIKYVAFYGESTVSNADNDFFVDNVRIRLGGQAPEHVTLLAPEDNSTTVDPANCILNWQNAVGGGAPTYYEVFVGTSLIDPGNDYYGEYLYETTNSNLDLSAQTDIDLGFNTTWYWAVLPYNDDGNPDPTAGLQVFRFTTLPDPTIVALPHEEYFDDVIAPALPYGWTAVVDATSTSAYVNTYSSTTYSVSAPNVARMYNYSDTAANLMLITPEIDVPINTIKTKFYARGSTAGQVLLVGTVNPADSTFTEMGSIVTTTTQTQYEVSFDSYAGTDTYIAFKHGLGSTYRTIYIDNVQLLELLPNDLAATAVSNPGIMTAGTAYDFTVDVFNEGTATQSAYTVKLMSVDTRTELATLDVTTPLDPGASAQHILSWTPATGGVYEVYGKVVLTGDQNATNDDSPTTELYVLDNTLTVIPVGDDATTTSSTMLPVDMYYRNSVTEELYFTDEMHLQSGNITALVYKNTFLNERPDKAIKIWLAHTTVTDLSGGWLPTLDYTLVFDGTVDFPSGVNYVVIPLDTPFSYTGGTLATRFYRVFDSGALSSSDKFYYTTNPAHTVRSRYLRSDSTTYDPLAPSAAGTTLGYFPNTTFVVQNAVMQAGAVLNGYVYEAGGTTPVAGATVTLTDERYSTVTDIDGYYEFSFWEDHTVSAFASATDYYDSTPVTGIALTLGNTVSQNLYLQPLPEITVSGVVTSNDYPAGLEGATIMLFGYHNHETTSGVGGIFSIPNVKGNSAGSLYNWEVKKTGYESVTGSFTLYEANYDMGTINLTEYLWPAYELIASHAEPNASLVWEAAGEPDYYFCDFEDDNGGWVGSGYGDWEWTNTYTLTGYTDPDTYVDTPPTAPYSGSGLWGTKVLSSFSGSSAWSYLSQSFDLSLYDNPVLKLWHYMDGYNTWDYGLIKANGTTVWGSDAAAVFMPWQELTVDLSAYAGMTNVEISFEWYATSVVNYAGWYIDDVYVGPATRTAASYFGARNADRAFLNYSIYRRNPGGAWTQLESAWADTTYLDTGFASVGEGQYEWGVKANYDGSLQSEEILSNILGKIIDPPDVQDPDIVIVGTTVTFGWDPHPGATYYTIYGSNDPYAAWPWTIIGYSATASFNFETAAVPYKFFKITASDGEMPASKGVWPRLNK